MLAEETEKTAIELINDDDLKHTQWYTSYEDIYMSELSQFGHYTSTAQDDFGIEGNVEG